MKTLGLIFILFLILSMTLSAQDLGDFDRENPVILSGNLSIGSSLYQAYGRENRRSPFAYFITASPTIKLYGFDIPISFTYRDQQGSISNPFNRLSFNPSYKWAKLYLGRNSFQLSPYVLSGQLLNGYGVELTPGKFRFTALYGTLENPLAQIDSIVGGGIILPNYKRTAASVRIGIGGNRNSIDLIGFRAKDLINESDLGAINDELVKPEENIVLGTEARFSPVKFLKFHLNIGASAFTANQSSTSITAIDSTSELLNRVNDAFTLNLSTRVQFAGDAGVEFDFKNLGFGFTYKRVDPFYKSLGTFYFLEDYENYTANIRFKVLGGKIRFKGRGGIQKNNLNNLRNYTRQRNILNMNLSLVPSRNFSTIVRYSNFQSDRTPGFFNVNDSIRYAQTTSQYSLTPIYSFGDTRRSTIQASLNFQELLDISTGESEARTIDNYTVNLTYSLQMRKSGTGANLSILGNRNEIEERISDRLGGSVGLSKRLLDKKLSLTSSVGYFQNNLNGVYDGNSVTGRVGVRYRNSRKYSISANLNYLNRSSVSALSFSELRASIRSTILFNTKKSKKQ